MDSVGAESPAASAAATDAACMGAADGWSLGMTAADLPCFWAFDVLGLLARRSGGGIFLHVPAEILCLGFEAADLFLLWAYGIVGCQEPSQLAESFLDGHHPGMVWDDIWQPVIREF